MMNPDDPLTQVRIQVAGVMVRMMAVGQALKANADTMDDKTAMIIGTLMMLTCQYAAIAMRIVNAPTVEQPILGRRCIFY